MISLRQLEANRRNAQKSTGPVTAEGKAAVAHNAVRHGIFTEALLIEGEDPEQLEAHRAKLLADIAPQNYAEEILAERIISATWRLRRLTAAEQRLHESLADAQRRDLSQHSAYPGEDQDQAAADAARYGSKEQYRLKRLVAQRRHEWAMQQSCPAGLTLAIDLECDSSPIDRFTRYEKRLEGAIHRAWRELRLLRKDEGERMNDEPESIKEDAPAQNVQNKPISSANDDGKEVYGAAKALPMKSAEPGFLSRERTEL